MTIAHLSRNALRRKYICIDHFEKRFIQKEDGIRKRLNKLAVPVHYKADQSTENFPDSPVASTSEGQEPTEFKVLTPKKVYPGVKKREENEEEGDLYDTELFTTPKKRKRPADSDTPNCKRLKTVIEDTKKMLKKERMKYRRLQKKILNKKFINLSTTKFKSDASKVLTQMQLKKTAYNHLRNQGVVLAAPTTIQNWLQATDCLPGLNDDIFENIRNKFADSSIKDKACTK
ncbi:uncharacterized protein LOC134663351 [Cydia fagiglandana]|uniref:uncharacterized protein LOC134663351 n=1 Tax=Cydia fagiglandana TaxID=1458189 RepID=UPI002FEDEEBF